jgi:hypothetical protein
MLDPKLKKGWSASGPYGNIYCSIIDGGIWVERKYRFGEMGNIAWPGQIVYEKIVEGRRKNPFSPVGKVVNKPNFGMKHYYTLNRRKDA